MHRGQITCLIHGIQNWPISDPTKFQQGESSERPPDKEEQASDVMQPCMRVDFPRWEEGDLTGWLLRAERYFHYHRTSEAFMVDIAIIHHEGDAFY
ncbi:hypothetical protein B296_00004165 [Ensete ventricosum]|uniref:Uncharacterized protein n=1 Tax=Ensete ventricosum TaxID=4639 RepID=A0A427ARV3_ENSVE|nr:hypothetical protein B296_00004165 [Ensete ventricosum]